MLLVGLITLLVHTKLKGTIAMQNRPGSTAGYTFDRLSKSQSSAGPASDQSIPESKCYLIVT